MCDMVKEPARPLSADHAKIRRMLEALLGEGSPITEARQRTPDETARLEMVEALLQEAISETRRQ